MVQHAQHHVHSRDQVGGVAPRLVAVVEGLHQARQHRQQAALLQVVVQEPVQPGGEGVELLGMPKGVAPQALAPQHEAKPHTLYSIPDQTLCVELAHAIQEE